MATVDYPASPFTPACYTSPAVRVGQWFEGTAILWRYDEARADRVINFFERILVHTKGKYAGKPFILTEWQKIILRSIFGTVRYDDFHADWIRQYQLAWIELGRKNGKSEIAAGIALYCLGFDGEFGAEVYGAAKDKDQATVVYHVAKAMVELSPVLSRRYQVIDSKKRIVDPKTNSFYQVIPADAGGALGTNPSCIIFDEILTQPNRDLWDALKTGQGTRKQPLMLALTTASNTSAQFCLEEHKYGQRVAADPTLDPQRYVFMRNTPDTWDWRNEGVPPCAEFPEGTGWYYANPALGDFLNINVLRSEAQEAKEKPQAQNAFRVFHLNQWVSQGSRWLDMAVYDENEKPPIDEAALAGRACWAGLDLASTTDFAGWVLLFPGSPTDAEAPGYTVVPRLWIPAKRLTSRAGINPIMKVWAERGLINVTAGETINYDDIETAALADAAKYDIRMIGFDQWQSAQLVSHLEDAGLLAVKIPQTMQRLTAPSKEFERQLVERTMYHGGHPVLRWMADNVEAETSQDGLSMKPSKKLSGDSIDGIAAAINAMAVALLPQEEPGVFEFIAF